MSDFEYFSTIGAFAAGFIFLLYLFRTRAKLIRKMRIKMLEAKARIHYMTRPKNVGNGIDLDTIAFDVDGIENMHIAKDA